MQIISAHRCVRFVPMEGIYAKSPESVGSDMGQAEAAISAQLAAVRSEKSGVGGSVYDKVVQTLLYAVTILVPLFYLPWTSGMLEYNKQMLLIGVTAVALVVWLLGSVVRGKLTVRTTPVDKGVLGVLLASVLAAIFSLTPAKSVFGFSTSLSSSLLSVIGLTAFYFLAVNTLHDRGRMLRSALLTAMVLSLLVGVLRIFSFDILPAGFAAAGAFNTVGSLNALGILAAVGIALFAKTMHRGVGRLTNILSIAGIALSVIVLVVLNWWVLWAVALGGMLAMIAFDSLNITQLSEDYGGRRNRYALSRFIVPMVVVVLGAFLLLVQFNLSSVKAGFPVEVAPSYSLSWQVAKNVIRHDPLLGWGPENYSLAFDNFGAGKLATTEHAGSRFFDGISELATVTVQQGIVGLVALLLLIWCIVQVIARFGGAISESVARGESVSLAIQSTGTIAAMIAMIVALFVYPMNMTLWFVFYVLLALCGLIVSGDHSRTVDIEERPMYSLSASLGFIVGLILVLCGLYFTSVRYLADVRYAGAIKMGTPTAMMDGIAKAVDLNPANDRYLRDASQVALALLREEIAKKDGDDQQPQRIQNLIASSVQLAQKATEVQPKESLNWNNLGQVYQSMTGLVDNVEALAEDAFRKAAELRPGDPSFDNEVGQMWMARSDLLRQVEQRATGGNAATLRKQREEALVKAEASFKKAVERSSTYGLAIYNLGAVYDRQNKVKEAIEQLEKIAPYNSNQPTLMFEIGLLYIRNEQKDNAIAAMQRAVLLAPQYANARWYLALLLEEKNDVAGALAQLKEIQKNNEENTVLKEKIAQLEAGQRQIPPDEVIETKPLQ